MASNRTLRTTQKCICHSAHNFLCSYSSRATRRLLVYNGCSSPDLCNPIQYCLAFRNISFPPDVKMSSINTLCYSSGIIVDVEYIYGFVWWGGLQAKSMTSQRYRAVTRWRICVTMATLWQQQDGGYALLWQRYGNNKMADMCYYGNVMTTTRWWLCGTMETLWQQQDGGYVLLWQRYDNNKITSSVYDCTFVVGCVYWACYILHLQQYSHRLNLFSF